MLHFVSKENNKYIIEKTNTFSIWLLPGCLNNEIVDWIARERSIPFNSISNKLEQPTDADERDNYYYHLLIWHNHRQELIAGQRLRFNYNNFKVESKHSYLEHCYPGLHEYLEKKNLRTSEIGRTFIMPKYQNKIWLKELIRAFVRIPEANGISHAMGMVSFNHKNISNEALISFISSLEYCGFKGSIKLPETKFKLEIQTNKDLKIKNWDGFDLDHLEKNIRKIDSRFTIPPVFKMYRKLTSLKYEGISIANDYNGLMQILMSGSSELINKSQRRILKPYASLSTWD